MRIGIDARLWNESGVGRYTRNLVKELQKLDRKNEYVLFVLSKNKDEILHSVQNDNFKIAIADIRWHTIEEQIKFPAIIDKENLDLVHFTYFSIPIFYNKPFVVTIHDLILHHFPTGQASTLPFPFYWIKLFGYKFVMQQAARKALKIITVSHTTKEEIVNHLGIDEGKIVVTYEGVDDKISNSKSSSFAKASADKQNTKYKILNTKYFLYVGNAYPHKNLERLIKAFAGISSPAGGQESGIKLVLVGKEDYFYKRLKEKVKKMGLENSVIFFGQATDEELVSLYRNARALIMPSLMEGFGLPILEAMANKCLVLASNIPVNHEIAGDAAVYFDPTNIEEIAQKINIVLSNNKNYSDNIKNGLERSKKFSWNKMARQTLAVYESSVSI